MVKTVQVSDEAFAVISAHSHANGETQVETMDELVQVANSAWEMDMPEMQGAWRKFRIYLLTKKE